MNPDLCTGWPSIRGFRYPLDVILELLSAGMSKEEILADYDDLEPENIAGFRCAIKPHEERGRLR